MFKIPFHMPYYREVDEDNTSVTSVGSSDARNLLGPKY